MTREEIIRIRKFLQLSQERFAHLLGTTCATINRWESGRVKPSRMSVKQLMEIKTEYKI